MRKIYLYNSLTKKKELFQPLGKIVKMYSCGPTVYDFAHIGNYRSFLFSDLLHRVLRLFGYSVKLVNNLTDLDDKMIKAAQENNITLKEHSEIYAKAFFEDLKTLRILPADIYPRATQHIPQMIAMIETLLKKNHAYIADGSVYFRIASFSQYGKLNNIKAHEQIEGASGRINSDEYSKEKFNDFVLWKKHTQADGDVYYESPFGKGRPGWHTECAAMSTHYLGETFDIHTGGIDNRFPHHENEIAQSECCYEKLFARYWMHAAHLLVEDEKMSKSLGNFYTLRDIINKGANPIALRYMLLSTHYKNNFNFTFDGILAAEKTIERVNFTVKKLQENTPSQKNLTAEKENIQKIKDFEEKFYQALADDLNVSMALAQIFEAISFVNPLLENKKLSEKTKRLMLDFLKQANEVFCFIDFNQKEEEDLPEEIKSFALQREQARKDQNFALSDDLRQKIVDRGYIIKDTPDGFSIKKIKND